MKNKYILLLIVVLVAAAMGQFASIRAKQASDDKINAEIDKLVQQTEIDAEKKISAIDTDIQRTKEEHGNNTKMTDLLKKRFDLESNRIGRVAALHQMPGIVKYNDLEDYFWNIRRGFLNRSDFESVGLVVPEEWKEYERMARLMNGK